MPPEISKFGKYEVLEKIGEGGFAVVYKGRDPFIKRTVAIKACLAEDQSLRQRFFREAEIAGQLQHPNIVTVFDFGMEGTVPFLVQEYLAGEDLDRLIKRRTPLGEVDKLGILLQVASGLGYAHGMSVIHRDIKPGNVRLLEGAGPRVKIMDFGIAKLQSAEIQLTGRGITMGTAGYLAPEQLRGSEVDARADIFSFGVVAYELLTLVRPFMATNFSALVDEILHKEPISIERLMPDLPPELTALVQRCLRKNPAERYNSFAEIIPELEAIIRVLRTQDPEAKTTLLRRPAEGAEALDPYLNRQPETPRAQAVPPPAPAAATPAAPPAPSPPPAPPPPPPDSVRLSPDETQPVSVLQAPAASPPSAPAAAVSPPAAPAPAAPARDKGEVSAAPPKSGPPPAPSAPRHPKSKPDPSAARGAATGATARPAAPEPGEPAAAAPAKSGPPPAAGAASPKPPAPPVPPRATPSAAPKPPTPPQPSEPPAAVTLMAPTPAAAVAASPPTTAASLAPPGATGGPAAAATTPPPQPPGPPRTSPAPPSPASPPPPPASTGPAVDGEPGGEGATFLLPADRLIPTGPRRESSAVAMQSPTPPSGSASARAPAPPEAAVPTPPPVAPSPAASKPSPPAAPPAPPSRAPSVTPPPGSPPPPTPPTASATATTATSDGPTVLLPKAALPKPAPPPTGERPAAPVTPPPRPAVSSPPTAETARPSPPVKPAADAVLPPRVPAPAPAAAAPPTPPPAGTTSGPQAPAELDQEAERIRRLVASGQLRTAIEELEDTLSRQRVTTPTTTVAPPPANLTPPGTAAPSRPALLTEPGATPTPAATPPATPAAAPGRGKGLLVGGIAAVLGVVAVGWLVLGGGERPPASVTTPEAPRPQPPPVAVTPPDQGTLLVEASPWGQVVKLVDVDGQEQPLPATAYTPLAMALPPGRYTVTLAHPDALASRTCVVEIAPGAAQACRVEFRTIDVAEYLQETGWWR